MGAKCLPILAAAICCLAFLVCLNGKPTKEKFTAPAKTFSQPSTENIDGKEVTKKLGNGLPSSGTQTHYINISASSIAPTTMRDEFATKMDTTVDRLFAKADNISEEEGNETEVSRVIPITELPASEGRSTNSSGYESNVTFSRITSSHDSLFLETSESENADKRDIPSSSDKYPTLQNSGVTDLPVISGDDSDEAKEVKFKLSGEGLPNMDPFGGAPDPFVELRGAIGYARSETLGDTHDPEWDEKFIINYNPDEAQEIRIEVRDHDPANPDDRIGWANFKVKSMMESCKDLTLVISGGRGTIIVNRLTGCGMAWWVILLLVIASIIGVLILTRCIPLLMRMDSDSREEAIDMWISAMELVTETIKGFQGDE